MLALNCSVTVTVTEAPDGAVILTGSGGGGGAAATAGSGAGGGGTAGTDVVGEAVIAEFEEFGAADVPSGLALCVGAGAGVELLHPLKNRVDERAKLAARYIVFKRMVFSGRNDLIGEAVYSDRLVFFLENCPKNRGSTE